ncbi:MAG: thiamine pyrophosphate-binding protein [Alphaproteobacteria bacterium]|nr:thiamine pyrophosphate-binding protein [Alphaproteobacteria bacterium]
MAETATVGEMIAGFLEASGATTAFGVISIHNMPILDAIGRRNRIRFVPSRTEAGAVNMADAHARVAGRIGVAFSSTGTAAGNTCGALVEALTAGTPVVHITGQIECAWLDRNAGFIHEARDQLAMLRAVCKAAFRVAAPEDALGTLREAVRVAMTPPMGPVSVEIPIDVQGARIAVPADLGPAPVATPAPDPRALDALADALANARRPLLWLGGGARGAADAAARLVALGFGVVTSVQGRGIVPESDPRSLGAFNLTPASERLYAGADAMVVAGSRLRGNETLKYTLKLPAPLFRIDIDPTQEHKPYPSARFVVADAATALAGLADRLAGRLRPDPSFADDIAAAQRESDQALRRALGPYAGLLAALEAHWPARALWVRDVTISNSTWGNRLPALADPRQGVHALGGGIGQGVPMAIGAALARQDAKTVVLVGDGGLGVSLGELGTLVESAADVLAIVMNDRGYGVIRNIQDAQYGGRHYFTDVRAPDLRLFAEAIGLPFRRVADAAGFAPAIADALARRGPAMIEIDMNSVGPFAESFAGPPVRKAG